MSGDQVAIKQPAEVVALKASPKAAPSKPSNVNFCFVPIEPQLLPDGNAETLRDLLPRANNLLDLSGLKLLSVDTATIDTHVDRARAHFFNFTNGTPATQMLRLWYDANAGPNSARHVEQAIAHCLAHPEEAAQQNSKSAKARVSLSFVEITPIQNKDTSEHFSSLRKRANEFLDSVGLVPISIETATVHARDHGATSFKSNHTEDPLTGKDIPQPSHQIIRIWYDARLPRNEQVSVVIKQAISDMAGTNVHLYIDQKKSWAARATMIGAFAGNRRPDWDLRFVPIVHPNFLAGKNPKQRQASSLNRLIEVANEFINTSTLKVFSFDTATVSYADPTRTKVDFGADLAVCVLRLWYKAGASSSGHNSSAAVLRHLIAQEQHVKVEMRELVEGIDAPEPTYMERAKEKLSLISCLPKKSNKVAVSTGLNRKQAADRKRGVRGGRGDAEDVRGQAGQGTSTALVPASTALAPASTAMVAFKKNEAEKEEAAAEAKAEKATVKAAKRAEKAAAKQKAKSDKEAKHKAKGGQR
jgi:hypothetical protein